MCVCVCTCACVCIFTVSFVFLCFASRCWWWCLGCCFRLFVLIMKAIHSDIKLKYLKKDVFIQCAFKHGCVFNLTLFDITQFQQYFCGKSETSYLNHNLPKARALDFSKSDAKFTELCQWAFKNFATRTNAMIIKIWYTSFSITKFLSTIHPFAKGWLLKYMIWEDGDFRNRKHFKILRIFTTTTAHTVYFYLYLLQCRLFLFII